MHSSPVILDEFKVTKQFIETSPTTYKQKKKKTKQNKNKEDKNKVNGFPKVKTKQIVFCMDFVCSRLFRASVLN